MPEWIPPALATVCLWGLWGFLPKITTQYIKPGSAIIYEVIGGILLAAIALLVFKVRPEPHPLGMILGILTGTLGFTGAFFFLTAMSKGPVTLVVTLSALYPVFSILLAVFFLHETVTLKQGLGIALAILAMILVAG